MSSVGKNTIAGELLRSFVERVEGIDAQLKQLRDDKGVVMAEAKAANLQPAGIRYIVKKRKMKPSERAEAEALEDMYMHAMGMAADNPLFRMVGLMNVDVTAKDSVIEAMKKFVPMGGIATIAPHPDLGKPRLWSLGTRDEAVRAMPWPLPKAEDLKQSAEALTEPIDNVVRLEAAR